MSAPGPQPKGGPRPLHPLVAFVVDARDAQVSMAPRRRRLLAALFLGLSGFTIAGMMACFKLAEAQLSLPQAIFLRALGGVLLTLPLFAVVRVGVLPEGRLRLYALRTALAVAALTCWLYSIAHLPLALASALSFSKSVFLLWLAAALLAERITARKIAATVVGLLGVGLVLDPSAEGAQALAGLAGLAAALLGGAMTVVVKQLSATEPTLRMMLYPLLGVAAAFAVPAWAAWRPIDDHALLLVAATAVFGSVSQWCFLTAYRLDDVSALAPIEYVRLLAAGLLGFAVFGETPTASAAAGAAFICLSAAIALTRRIPAA